VRTRVVRRGVEVPAQGLAGALHPVLARVYAGRDIHSLEELDHSLARLHPYTALAGVDGAVALLERACREGRRILVVADFDADGATSCALAVRGLRLMGAGSVDYLVPDRFRLGYGLSPEVAALAAERGAELLVTVDNGVASVDGVVEAKRRGMQVLVTDHHLPRADGELPPADAIVNPNQPGDRFPSKALAGVGVVFYLLAALRARLRETRWFPGAGVPEPNLAQLLDLVALGTVADVVPLDHNNRILVSQGLARIRHGCCQPGVEALLQVAGRDPAYAAASDLGYAAGPRLNAAGRLTDMRLGIECLLTDDGLRAMEMARQLDALNRERRSIEAEMREQAAAQVQALELERDEGLPCGLCLFDQGWHQGVVGILAARVRERVHRPVVAFAPHDETELKGSARSVPGLHIRDVLDAVAARHPGLIKRFGGHAAAAGLTLARENLDAFAAAFEAEVQRSVSEDTLRGTLVSDGPLAAEDLSLELAETLRRAGPWGQGFPEPLFDGEFDVVRARVVGERHVRLDLAAGPRARRVTGIAFDGAEGGWLEDARRVFAAYRLDVNAYRGSRSAQLVVEHVEPVAD